MRLYSSVGFCTVCLVFTSSTYSQTTCFTNNDTVAAFFTQCASLSSTYLACNTLDGAPLNRCVCQQDVFNFIYGCENEYRSCYESYENDHNTEDVLSDWHQECDGFVTAKPTTPALTSLATTVAPVGVCQSIESVCTFGASALRDCGSKFPGPPTNPPLTNCECQSSLLSAASVCEYYGNQTCLLRPATLSNIGLFQTCQAQAASFLAAQSMTRTASSGSSTHALLPSGNSSPGATPLISNAGATMTSPSRGSASSAAAVVAAPKSIWLQGFLAGAMSLAIC